MEEKLQDVKRTLRSILMSSTKHNTIGSLHHDYKLLKGHDIPFRELGFSNCISFLKSIPDTVQVRDLHNKYIFYGVATPQTQHIKNLIDHQKNMRRPPGFSGIVSIPYELKSSIIRALNKYPEGLDISEIEQLVRQSRPHRHLLAQMGGVLEIIRNIPSVVYSRDGRRVKYEFTTEPAYQRSPHSFTSTSSAPMMPLDFNGPVAAPSPKKKQNGNQSDVDAVPTPTTPLTTKIDAQKEIHLLDEELSQPPAVEADRNEYTSDFVSDRMKENFFRLLDENPKGILCSELNNLYREKFHCSVEFTSLGYQSMAQLAADIRDVFVLENIDKADWLLLDARKIINQINTEKLKEIFKETVIEDRQIPQAIKYNIITLLLKYKSGITLDDFIIKYKDSHDLDFNNHHLWDFQSPLALLESLNDFIIINKNANVETLLFPKQSLYNSEISIPPIPSDDPTLVQQFPKHVASPTAVIDSQKLPDHIQIGDCVEVVINEIISPSCFWVNIHDPSCSEALDKLMDNMQEYFSDRQSDLLMPPICIRPNQLAAAVYEKEWHRVDILSIDNDDMTARLFYFDYGTIFNVAISKIYFLPMRFTKLKRQAVLCRLTQVDIPIGYDYWPLKSSEVFKELIYNKPLVAIVTHIDTNDHSFNALLVDTSGKKDVIINNLLVERGVAATTLGADFQNLLKKPILKKENQKSKKKNSSNIDHKNDSEYSPSSEGEPTQDNPRKIDPTVSDDSTYYHFEGEFQRKKQMARVASSSTTAKASDSLSDIRDNLDKIIFAQPPTSPPRSKKNFNQILEEWTRASTMNANINGTDWKNQNNNPGGDTLSTNPSINMVHPSVGLSQTTPNAENQHQQEQLYQARLARHYFNQLQYKNFENKPDTAPVATAPSASPSVTAAVSAAPAVIIYPQRNAAQENNIVLKTQQQPTLFDLQTLRNSPLHASILTIRLKKLLFHRVLIFEKNYLLTLELLRGLTALTSVRELMRIQLRSRMLNIPFLEFTRIEEPELFKKLDEYPIIYEKDTDTQTVNLIPLEYVPHLLFMFGIEDPDVNETLKIYFKQ